MTTTTTPNATLAPESYDEKFDRMKERQAQTTTFKQEPEHLRFRQELLRLSLEAEKLFPNDRVLMNGIFSAMQRTERLTGLLYEI